MKQYDRLMLYLGDLDCDECYDGVMKFHAEHEALIRDAKGSKSKHQDWPGGYVDHLVECLDIGDRMWSSLGEIRELPFDWTSVVKVLYFHDVEKIFKYSDIKPPNQQVATDAVFAKDWFYVHWLKELYGVEFSEDERNALDNIHGEKTYDEFRVCGRLGAFCHCCDMLSARMWYDKPSKEEKELT